MDHQLLRAFVTIARDGTLTRAAERLCISQPALSLQLKKLHEQVGHSLFDRTAHGMRLTEAGRQLLPAAERALAALAECRGVADGLSGAVAGRLRIGTIVDPEFLRLGPFLKRLVERHPRLTTDLSHGMSGTVARAIADGRLDVGYTLGSPGLPEHADRFAVMALSGFTYRVVAPPGWGERVRGRGWRELAALPWIGTPPDSAHHRLTARVFDREGVRPQIVAQVDLEASMLDLVRSGIGLSLARDSLALRAAHADGLALADAVSVDACLGFLCLKERQGESAIAAARAVMADVWGDGPRTGLD
ncbi:LysR family transcriptional regulator [Azospirillum griseum]|uniref:LysR family transcriptional regulator n=1 Tax=Azospirillum griseum TaxID=2496639 RepID=A0A3S0HZQ1_9PROT|nr:LysR family transcriptional regulator [Azospirillum griseum]RTR23063.1 LysR family transcriptional regulator [Azospirillum griseum]